MDAMRIQDLASALRETSSAADGLTESQDVLMEVSRWSERLLFAACITSYNCIGSDTADCQRLMFFHPPRRRMNHEKPLSIATGRVDPWSRFDRDDPEMEFLRGEPRVLGVESAPEGRSRQSDHYHKTQPRGPQNQRPNPRLGSANTTVVAE